jgi:hypothetical protein
LSEQLHCLPKKSSSLRKIAIQVSSYALPLELLELLSEEKKSPGRKDLHHLLKARMMEFRIPIQLILPSTYDESKARKQKRAGTRRPLQDEATRAWNIFSALYYKAGGAIVARKMGLPVILGKRGRPASYNDSLAEFVENLRHTCRKPRTI